MKSFKDMISMADLEHNVEERNKAEGEILKRRSKKRIKMRWHWLFIFLIALMVDELPSFMSILSLPIVVYFFWSIYQSIARPLRRLEDKELEKRIANGKLIEKTKKRIEEKGLEDEAYCPRCGCKSIQFISNSFVKNGKKRTGAGLATSLINPIAGIIVGNSNKSDTIYHTENCVCLKCGYKWNPSQLTKDLRE